MSLVAQTLAVRGHDVTMALVREKERTYPIHPRVRMIQFRYRANGTIGKAVERMRQIRTIIKAGEYDYVVCYMWDLNVTTLIASLGLRKRVIVSERGFPGTSSRSRWSRVLENLSYRFAYRIVYQTRDAQAFCPPRLAGRSVVVPNMIETREGRVYQGERDRRVVSIGRLGSQKNFPLLLRSFARFAKTNPEWTLEIYGKGPLESELKKLANYLEIGDKVVFAGYVEDVVDRIRDAGMFVLSSDYEGISNAMSEAMALGLPVVCTDCPVGGAALLINHRDSGMLVPIRDERALSRAMIEVGTDEALARRISEGARASVARFAPERLAATWEDRVLCR